MNMRSFGFQIMPGLVSAVALLTCLIAPARGAELQMMDLSSLPKPDVEPQVIGGEPANPASWPATLIFRNPEGGGCTATVIGPRVVLTAAHCIKNNATGKAMVGGAIVDLVCVHHPNYPQRISADFALCLLSNALPRLPFEKVNTAGNVLQQATKIRLLGYGCTVKDGIDRTFGSLFQGWADIFSREDLYVVTQGGSAVCFGDSGGGAFVYTSPAESQRVLVAVNSRGDISSYSWLSTTGTNDFVSWATAWAAGNVVLICGMHPQADGCRD